MILTPEDNTDIKILHKLRTVPDDAYIKGPAAIHQKGFSAGSYRDLTRVSKLNEPMWTELFFENKDNLINEIDFPVEKLSEYSDALKTDDKEKLVALLREGTDSKKQAK